MADRAIALVDRAGGSWLSRTSGNGQVRGEELAILRRVALLSSLALVAVPAGLSFLTTPAVALPVGVATVCAAFLFSAVGSIALSRQKPLPVEILPVAPRQDLMLEVAAGLVLMLDAQGVVTTVGGRDRAAFLAWMRPALGRGFFEQVHVSDRILFLQALDAIRQGTDAVTIRLRLDRPTGTVDGEQFAHISLDMTARRDGDGAISAIVAQARDIGREQQQRNAEARKAAEAESANDAKSRFLAAVSHELRTPLNAILGFSDMLAGEYVGPLANDRQREYVGLIRDSGAHLLSVVNAMLDMSKIEAGRYELIVEPFSIASTIKSCEAMLSLQAKAKGLKLASRIQRDICEVVADQRAIQQVLINLVGNAIKFTDAGGAVTVDATQAGDMLKICVSDTGIGIAPERLATLGQPFVQIQSDHSRRYEGTGLGLSLVKGLIALHGGSFGIASTPGHGTVITVLVPLDGTMVQTAEHHEPVEFPPRLRSVEHPEEQSKEAVYGHAKAKIA